MTFRFAYDQWNETQWRDLTAGLHGLTIHQHWQYALVHSSGRLRRVSRVMLLRDNQAVVAAHFRIKMLPVLHAGVAEMDHGPLLASDAADVDDALVLFLRGVRERFCERSKLEVRLWLRSSLDALRDARLARILVDCGFARDSAAHPYSTFILDLSLSLSELRAGLHGKWRNQLNVAERAGLTIDAGCSVELFDRFSAIYEDMWRTKRFPTGVRVSLIRALQCRLPEADRFRIALARSGNQDIAATVCATVGDAMQYFLGASRPDSRQTGRPGYLLQWDNIEWAKVQGYRWYDTGGFDADAAPDVARFKRRMGGTPIVSPGCFVAVPPRGTVRLYRAAERVYRETRHLATGR